MAKEGLTMIDGNFPRGQTTLSMDNNEIKGVYYGPEDSQGWGVGFEGVVSIHAYDEFGQGSMVPWLAICSEEKVIARIAATNCTIMYKTD